MRRLVIGGEGRRVCLARLTETEQEELLGKEEAYFREYLYQLRQSFPEEELSYFELNLEVRPRLCVQGSMYRPAL